MSLEDKENPLEHVLKLEKSLVMENSVPDANLDKWVEKIDWDVIFAPPQEVHYETFYCENLFEENEDVLQESFFHSQNGSDLIDFLAGESKVNDLNPLTMKVIREDTSFIIQNDDLLMPITNGLDGIISNEVMDHRQILAIYFCCGCS